VTEALRLTAAICTWNRADLLRRTLDQMRQLESAPNTEWELLVVNNNCTDHTDQVLEEFRDSLPLRRVFESKPGLSNARNAAVSAASGAFILWLDDDVLVAPQWLASYADAIRRHPSSDILGGPIEPWFDGTPPEWLARGFHAVENAYAAKDPGGVEAEITTANLPFGANMAVRRETQLLHPYDPALGRGPGNMLGCEELAVLNGILQGGGRGYWVPGARVRHFIPQSRQSLSYLWRYCRGNGISAARIAPNRGRFRVLGSPGWLWRDATTSTLRWLVGVVASPPERWLRHMQTAAWSWGRLQGAWQRD
jgi:glycosyltransferase involved in cell wall biosynthesis